MLTSRQDHHYCSNKLIHSICLNLKWECKSTPTKKHFPIILSLLSKLNTTLLTIHTAPYPTLIWVWAACWHLLLGQKNVAVVWMWIDVLRDRRRWEKEGQCIRNHPGFESVCLNWWVLQAAGASSKTRSKKSYTTVLTLVGRAEAEQVWSLYFCRKGHVSQHK